MLSSFLVTSLRILTFRAGPQDLPYEPRLSAPLALLAALANVLMLVQVLPLGAAILLALGMVAGMALITQAILRTRKLEARFHQTFAALVTTTALITFALVPLFAQLAPAMREISANPALLEQPDKLHLPQTVVFLMNLLNLWNFAVSASIFRHAANVGMGLGLVLALVAALTLLMFVAMLSLFAGALLGGAAAT